jgi:putative FmdB family regulatory protein
MPIYEYVCQKCGHHLEVMQKLSDKPLSKCPECRGKLEKIISQTSFQLKGAGWYVTDYAGRNKTEKTETAEKKPEGEKKEAGEKSAPKEPSEKKAKKETAKTGAATSKSDS